MDWNSIYQARVTSADEAVKSIKTGNRIFMTGNVSVPQTLSGGIGKLCPTCKECRDLSGPFHWTGGLCQARFGTTHPVNTLFISDKLEKLSRMVVQISPRYCYQSSRYFLRTRSCPWMWLSFTFPHRTSMGLLPRSGGGADQIAGRVRQGHHSRSK